MTNKIRGMEYCTTKCIKCGCKAILWHGYVIATEKHSSGLTKKVLIHAGFCKVHAINAFLDAFSGDEEEDMIYNIYNKNVMGDIKIAKNKELENV